MLVSPHRLHHQLLAVHSPQPSRVLINHSVTFEAYDALESYSLCFARSASFAKVHTVKALSLDCDEGRELVFVA